MEIYFITAAIICVAAAFFAGKRVADRQYAEKQKAEAKQPPVIDEAVVSAVIEKMARLQAAKAEHEALQAQISNLVAKSTALKEQQEEGIRTLQLLLDPQHAPSEPVKQPEPIVKVVEVVNEAVPAIPEVFGNPYEEVEDVAEEPVVPQNSSPVVAIAMPKMKYWELYNELKQSVTDYKSRWFLQAGQINGSNSGFNEPHYVYLIWDRKAFNEAPCDIVKDFIMNRYSAQIETLKVSRFAGEENGQCNSEWRWETLPTDVAFASAGNIVFYWGKIPSRDRFLLWCAKARKQVAAGMVDTSHLFPHSKEEYMRRAEHRSYHRLSR